jgi:hypothetical protein
LIRPRGAHGIAKCCSVAGLLITTEAMIAENPEKKKEVPAIPAEAL